ncbi:jg27358, partial [Pararge aegeria aegeria]
MLTQVLPFAIREVKFSDYYVSKEPE